MLLLGNERFKYCLDIKPFKTLPKKKKSLYNNINEIFSKEKFTMATMLPSIFVPLVGLVFPAIAMASLFLYIEQDQIS